MKKILIIGNGFDKANGLPTQYNEFLDFCEKAEKIYTEENLDTFNNEFKTKYLDPWGGNDCLKDLLNDAFISKSFAISTITTKSTSLNELFDCINGNIWYNYFQNISLNGHNWIDFETEITKVIKKFDDLKKKKTKSKNIGYDIKILEYYTDFKPKDFVNIWKFSSNPTIIPYETRTNRSAEEITIEEIDCFMDVLYKHLNKITRALEIYLSSFVSQIKPTIVQDISEQEFDYILSFNYTNTFEKHYKKSMSKDAQICYIHGKADSLASVDTCNLVLGIDEYLKKHEKNTNLDFLAFKKFYQRIIKQTDNSYSVWLDSIHERNKIGQSFAEDFELYIFGHSLDVTDKDILKDFILNDNVQTKIYYYQKKANDKSNFSSKISNLIKIIKQKELISRTSGGSKNTINFILQKPTHS